MSHWRTCLFSPIPSHFACTRLDTQISVCTSSCACVHFLKELSHCASFCNNKPYFLYFLGKKIKIKIKTWSSKDFQSSKVKWMWKKHHGLSMVFAYTTDLLQFSFNWNPRHFEGQKHCQNYARACLDKTLVLQELPVCFSSEGRLDKKEF